jgi:hypothetical protein
MKGLVVHDRWPQLDGRCPLCRRPFDDGCRLLGRVPLREAQRRAGAVAVSAVACRWPPVVASPVPPHGPGVHRMPGEALA